MHTHVCLRMPLQQGGVQQHCRAHGASGVCVSACTRTSRIQESSVHSFCPLWPSVTSVPSHRRGWWGLRVYMRMWHFGVRRVGEWYNKAVAHVIFNSLSPWKPAHMLGAIHPAECVCVCVCGDAAVHPASSGGSTHTLHMPAAVCVWQCGCLMRSDQITKSHLINHSEYKQIGMPVIPKKRGGGIHKPVAGFRFTIILSAIMPIHIQACTRQAYYRVAKKH